MINLDMEEQRKNIKLKVINYTSFIFCIERWIYKKKIDWRREKA
jgi:hypothetical protein